MSLSSVRYVIKETVLSLRRNTWMSFASSATVAISLIILGFALTLIFNTSNLAGSMESDIQISAFVRVDQTPQQVSQLQTTLQNLSGVKQVTLVSKQQALNQMSSSLSPDLLKNLDGSNPLPDKFIVKVTYPNQVKAIATAVQKVPGIDRVNYGQGIVERILKFTHWIRSIGFTIMALLALASIVLISITIRLTVFARRKEVHIMKYVGATNWFIRWPFMLEGMIIGLVGAIIAAAVVVYGYQGLVTYIQANLTFVPVINSYLFIRNIVLLLMFSGMIIGAVGSLVSLRRFLHV
ncbi:MAG TPA: permease-like cell division protein FtsX [Desulfobacteria bacterium]|nr:permease-like cell division protein FtsX [Desulfobacteria bacterium]